MDATNALRCADMMLDALQQWNRERDSRAEPPLSIGIGLNYGPAVIGDVGSEHSFSFTVIGDTVSTASRLQGLTRILQTPLVIADAVVAAVEAASCGRAVDLLARLQAGGEQTVRGRSSMVRVWTRLPPH